MDARGGGQDALVIEGLTVCLGRGPDQRTVVHSAGLRVPRGAVTCLVGASGSGKSVLVKALLGVLADTPGVVAGRIRLSTDGGVPVELLDGLEAYVSASPEGIWSVAPDWHAVLRARMRPFWGQEVGYVPQHAAHALDPTRPVGAALIEALRGRRGQDVSRRALREEALEWLSHLRLDHPEAVLELYPAQLSGGMAQRVLIACALARGARILFTDEPTSALDAEAQAALLDLLTRLRTEGRLETLVLITHDLGVAHRIADRLVVMHEGGIVDGGEARDLLAGRVELSPHTRRLWQETGRLEARSAGPGASVNSGPVLEARDLVKRHGRRAGWLRRDWVPVLRGAELSLYPGEVVGLMGESGSGKSTLAACLAGVSRLDGGELRLEGHPMASRSPLERRAWRRRVQLLYQTPGASLHPCMRVEDALMETACHLLELGEPDARSAVDQVLEQVRLTHRRGARAAQLSGGELRRVDLARILLLRPEVFIADEPTANVDAALRAGLLEIFRQLRDGPTRTSILLISHDPQVIRHVADRVVILRQGVVESLRIENIPVEI